MIKYKKNLFVRKRFFIIDVHKHKQVELKYGDIMMMYIHPDEDPNNVRLYWERDNTLDYIAASKVSLFNLLAEGNDSVMLV